MPAPADAAPGRPKDLAKRAAILAAAKDLFVEQGFEATSMEAVAAQAGVSKLTVYSHYGDKLGLLREAVRAVGEDYLPPALFGGRGRRSLRSHLRRVAQAFVRLVASPESIAVHRMMAADASLAGQIGAVYYQSGPLRVRGDCAAMLAELSARGELAIADPERAARQLLVLLRGDLLDCAMWGVGADTKDPNHQAHIEATLDLFLRAYAPLRTLSDRARPAR